jgi:hypothetical protein
MKRTTSPWLGLTLVAGSLWVATASNGLRAAQYEQRQGPAAVRLQADTVEAGRVEVRLSGELLLTLSVEGRSPLRVGNSDDAVREEQTKAILASGAWMKCQAAEAAVRTDLGDGRQRWQQSFRLDPLKDGLIELQLAPLSYTEGTETQPEQVTWQPIPVHVMTDVVRPDLGELRDITPIEEVPPGRSWPRPALWIGSGFLLLGLVLVLVELVRRRARKAVFLSPDRWALQELLRINALQDSSAAEVERYHLLLSDVVRKYLELRYRLRASQQTTAEFLEAMRRSPQLTQSQQELLQEFLERCDLAKFARAQPSPEECQAVAGMARRFVEETAGAAPPAEEQPLRAPA